MESFQVSTGREENGYIRKGKCAQESKSKNERARIINTEEAEGCEMGKVYQRGKIHAEEGGHTTEREGNHACKGVETRDMRKQTTECEAERGSIHKGENCTRASKENQQNKGKAHATK